MRDNRSSPIDNIAYASDSGGQSTVEPGQTRGGLVVG
jgi:hypothetical protein